MQSSGAPYQGSVPHAQYSDHTYDNPMGVHCPPGNYQGYVNGPYPVASPRPPMPTHHHYSGHQMQQGVPYRGNYPPSQNQYGPPPNQDMYRNHHSAYVGTNHNGNRNMPVKPVWGENNSSEMMPVYNHVPPRPQMMPNSPAMNVSSMRSPPHIPGNINPVPSPGAQHYRQMQSPGHSPQTWSQAQVPSPVMHHASRATPSPLPPHARSPGHSQPFSPPSAAHMTSMPNITPHSVNPVLPENCQQSPMVNQQVPSKSATDPLHSLQKMVMLDQNAEQIQMNCHMANDNCDQSSMHHSNQMATQQNLSDDSKDSPYATYFNLDENRLESEPQGSTPKPSDFIQRNAAEYVANSPRVMNNDMPADMSQTMKNSHLHMLNPPDNSYCGLEPMHVVTPQTSVANLPQAAQNQINGPPSHIPNSVPKTTEPSLGNSAPIIVNSQQSPNGASAPPTPAAVPARLESSNTVAANISVFDAPNEQDSKDIVSSPKDIVSSPKEAEKLDHTVPCNELKEEMLSEGQNIESEMSSIPVVNEISSVPVVSEITSVPGPDEISSTPVSNEISSVPVSNEITSIPVSNEISSTPVSIEINDQSSEVELPEEKVTVAEKQQSYKPSIVRLAAVKPGETNDYQQDDIKPVIDEVIRKAEQSLMTLNEREGEKAVVKQELLTEESQSIVDSTAAKIENIQVISKAIESETSESNGLSRQVTTLANLKSIVKPLIMSDATHNPVKVVIHRIRTNPDTDSWHVPDAKEEASIEKLKPSNSSSPRTAKSGPQIIILSSASNRKKNASSDNPKSTASGKKTVANNRTAVNKSLASKLGASNSRRHGIGSRMSRLNRRSSSSDSPHNSPQKRKAGRGRGRGRGRVTVRKIKEKGGLKKKKGRVKKNMRGRPDDSDMIEVAPKLKKIKTFHGPYVHVTGSRQKPSAITVVNMAIKDEDKGKLLRNKPEIMPKRPRVGHTSTLSPHYDAFNKDRTWLCVFCNKGSHCAGLGDLYGPYYIKNDDTCANKETSINSPKATPTSTHSILRGARAKRRKSDSSFVESEKPSTSKKVKVSNKIESSVGKESSIPTQGEQDPAATNLMKEVWIHEDCAVWCQSISLMGSQIYGLEDAIQESKENICSSCKLTGATLGCWGKACKEEYHFSCAKEKSCQLDIENFSLFCPKHKVKRSVSSPKNSRKSSESLH